jgi:hypothetical protein
MGLDGRNPEVGIERYFLFKVDGPSLIRATLSNTSGRTRACLWQGNLVEQRQCATIRNGTLEHAVFDTGQTSWTLSLIGSEQALGPVVDLTLDFNATAPSVAVENLRFQGTPTPNYNGIIAEVDALFDGSLTIDGTFDAGQSHAHRVVIDQVGGSNVYDQTAGPDHEFSVVQAVTAATSYRTTVMNPSETSEPSPVFIGITFTWP